MSADLAPTEPWIHYEFWHSHYCEKSRWALDLKGVPYRPRVLVPVHHVPIMYLATGQRQVPAIKRGGTTITGSTAILEHLDEVAPDPPLFPSDPALRAAVDAEIDWFDRKLGPGLRRAGFFDMLRDRRYLNGIMARPYGGFGRALYTLATPINKAIFRVSMQVDAAGAERGRDITRQALERLAAAGDGYLVGDRFTAADLTAAALLYILAGPPEAPQWPADRPASMQGWIDTLADHPGCDWVRRIYREHRHPR